MGDPNSGQALPQHGEADQPPAAVRFSGGPMGACAQAAPVLEAHKARRTLRWSSWSDSKRVRDCIIHLQMASRRRADAHGLAVQRRWRKSGPARIEQLVVLIRDGECNREQSSKVIFVQLQMGWMGWDWGVAEQRGTDQGPAGCCAGSWELGAGPLRLVYAPSFLTTAHARRSTLAPAAVARYTFVIVPFTPVTRYRLYLV